MLLTAILLLSGCSVQKKITNLFQEGRIKQTSFNVEIPFEYRLGLVIIKVELNNETYDFVFDSGAPNVLSKELAATLGIKGLITQDIGGHQGNRQPMDFTKIEALTIGGITFEETAAGIGDFNQSTEVGCLEIDGIIGSNLMRLAVWKIDYRNQIITITNTKESLSLGKDTKRIPFYSNSVHTPYCDLKINGIVEKNMMLDLGATEGFNLSYNNYKKIQKAVSNNKEVVDYGYHGAGFYGYGNIDSLYYLQADDLSIGEIQLNNQVIKFSKSFTPTIGTGFFKNYDLVMNWTDQEFLLSPHTVYDNHKLIHKGINFNYQDGALSIASLVTGSEAEALGIQVGDKVIQIDGKDYAAMTQAAYCKLFGQANWYKEIKRVVINRNGEALSFDLKNKVLIE